MILVYLHSVSSPIDSLLISASKLAAGLKKELGVLLRSNGKEDEIYIKSEFERLNLHISKLEILSDEKIDFSIICEKLEASFLLVQWDLSKKNLKKGLRSCRNLRIPYLFFKQDFSPLSFHKILLTVSFLPEDFEKGQFGSAFGRFLNSHITLFVANDYGLRAKETANKMKQLFDKFSLSHTELKGKKDSYKIDKEGVFYSETNYFDIVFLSASREYGPDDLLFGPSEYHLIKKSSVPLVVINPRDDLYTLCD